jgi:D-sedoheptulose 7-phosphate isomerase
VSTALLLQAADVRADDHVLLVGKPDGYAAKHSTVSVVIPQVDPDLITPISEGYQAVVWHSMVSHPDLQVKKTTW